MPNLEKTNRILLRFTDDQFKLLDNRRHEQRAKWQAIGEKLFLDVWLKESEKEGEIVAKEKSLTSKKTGNTMDHAFSESPRAHYLLEYILRSNIPPFATAIIENLEAFAAAADAVTKHHARDPDYPVRLPDDTSALRRRVDQVIAESEEARRHAAQLR